MGGGVRVAHLSSSAEKSVSFRLSGLTVMFIETRRGRGLSREGASPTRLILIIRRQNRLQVRSTFRRPNDVT